MRFDVRAERWRLREPFAIARETIDHLPLVHLTINADGVSGQAEATGVDYRGETPAGMIADIEAYLGALPDPPTRAQVQCDLPAGGVRNAIDCALWDLEAKRDGTTAAAIGGGIPTTPLATAYTIGLDAPAAMARGVARAPAGALLKLKLGGRDGQDIARVAAVRRTAPDARIVVDVNEGWSLDTLVTAAPRLADLGVELIEQPLPRSLDHELAHYAGPVPLCADESFDELRDLARMDAYRFVNVKLDKCGGLTAALEIVTAARERGIGLFVGSMLGTSLGMAPAFLVGQYCHYVDLDGPLLLADDRTAAMRYRGATIDPPDAALWG